MELRQMLRYPGEMALLYWNPGSLGASPTLS